MGTVLSAIMSSMKGIVLHENIPILHQCESMLTADNISPVLCDLNVVVGHDVASGADFCLIAAVFIQKHTGIIRPDPKPSCESSNRERMEDDEISPSVL